MFGREFEGLTDAELALCNATCSIPLGRLQESLSLTHCVSIALSEVFQYRLQYLPDERKALYSVGSDAHAPDTAGHAAHAAQLRL